MWDVYRFPAVLRAQRKVWNQEVAYNHKRSYRFAAGRTEIRRLAHDMGSVAYQGSRILQIHLFEMCMAAPGQAYEYLTTVNHLSMLIRQCFRGSAHNWTPTHYQPGTPYLLQREHVDAVIQNW
jgi:hypothetical protein